MYKNYIFSLEKGDKVNIYYIPYNGTMGQGVRGKDENIVEVIWDGLFGKMGLATLNNKPLGMFISDGDIVLPDERLNKLKNAFWDAGINVGVVNSTCWTNQVHAIFEILNAGTFQHILIDVSIEGPDYNVITGFEGVRSGQGVLRSIGTLNDSDLIIKIKNHFKI